MKIDPNKDYSGMLVHMTSPFQPLIGASFEPTAIQMRVDLLKAQIAHATAEAYSPAALLYQRRLRESRSR